MSKIMPHSEIEERYRWIEPILEGVLSVGQMTKVAPFSKRTIQYWIAAYHERGLDGLASKSREPHHSPRKTPDEIRDRIEKLKKENRIGGQKISWYLEDEGISIHERTVNKILKERGLVRTYRKRYHAKWKPEPVTIPGEMVEIDVKYGVRLAKYRWWYQFTAIDKASRWRHLWAYDDASTSAALRFLEQLLRRSPFPIQGIKTDNAGIFTNRHTGYDKSTDPLQPRFHPFDIRCKGYGIEHYLIDPGKPAQNGTVERSHRSDKETFYRYLERPRSLEEYRYYLNLWNLWYNDLKHCSLNTLSPNAYIKKVQNVYS